MLPLFYRREAEKLAPYREGINYKIELRKEVDRSLLALL